MQAILRRTDPPAICRQAKPPDASLTEYSMIALPRDRRVLFLYGDPSRRQYRSITLEPVAGPITVMTSSVGGVTSEIEPLDRDNLRDAIRLGCRWIQDVAQITTDELPPDTTNHKMFGRRWTKIEGEDGFGYTTWRGAIRGEYHAGEHRWWFFCPIWHTGQAVKALTPASQAIDEPRCLDGARLGAGFIFNNQVWDPADHNHGLVLAYEDVPGQVNTSAILEALDGPMILADHLHDDDMWRRLSAAGDFLIDRLYRPEVGVFRDLYVPSDGSFPDTVFHTRDGIGGRPLLDDGVLLKLYDRTNNDKYLNAHLRIAERLVADQNPPGNWLDYGPCSPSTKRFHPRQTYWRSIPLIDTYRRTGRAEFLDTAIASGHFCRRAMRADGGYIRGTYLDFRTDSFGHATSGSACAAVLFMRLFEETGDREWFDAASLALSFCVRVQFREPQDPNLRGAILEKVLPPDGTDRSPYYLRDLGTIFFVIAGVHYLRLLDRLERDTADRPSPASPELVQ